MTTNTRTVSWAALLILMLGLTGCNQGSNPTPKADSPEATKTAGKTHKHGEWWCSEHGVPEEICAQCKSELVAGFKAKGDWCEEHNRPDSQCFICHPEYQAKFAAQYEAKYGEQPPALGEESDEEGHDHKHDEKKDS